jgi:hypothetical protein
VIRKKPAVIQRWNLYAPILYLCVGRTLGAQPRTLSQPTFTARVGVTPVPIP